MQKDLTFKHHRSVPLESRSEEDDVDSLFDDPMEESHTRLDPTDTADDELEPAMLSAPPIPGLFVPTVRLPPELADTVMRQCMGMYFRGDANQVMLFGRASPGITETGLPPFLDSLLVTLAELLRPELPARTHALLFPPPDAPICARQAILNLYHPGEGITPHVDLLKRFGDGILGVSLGSGCVMSFCKDVVVTGSDVSNATNAHDKTGVKDVASWDLYLPSRSFVVLSGDARYRWTHGIEKRSRDFVAAEVGGAAEWLDRSIRVSITFRWLLPGADIVGGAVE